MSEKKEKTLKECTKKDIVKVLFKATLAKSHSEEIIKDDDWPLLADEVKSDYPNITLLQLDASIMNGIKGKYNPSQRIIVNFPTIYFWIDSFLKENKQGRLSFKM